MPSPFPGMDPWLEDHERWQGHQLWFTLALAEVLVAALKPRLVVSIEERIAYDEILREDTRERFITIATREGALITEVELLTPRQKRHPPTPRDGLATRHRVAIDLLRVDEGTAAPAALRPARYGVVVTRAGSYPGCEVYPIQLHDRLPTVEIPLVRDETIRVDLQHVFDTMYDRAGFDVYLDHDRPLPPPALEPDELAWVRSVLKKP